MIQFGYAYFNGIDYAEACYGYIVLYIIGVECTSCFGLIEDISITY